MPRNSLPPRDYPHLEFCRCWTLTSQSLLNLGRCETYIKCFGELPIDPTVQTELRRVSLERGALATTAIEGNTLTVDELREMLAGKKLPESRAYQAQEVRNALDLMNQLWQDVVLAGKRQLLSVATICEFNRQVGKDLGPASCKSNCTASTSSHARMTKARWASNDQPLALTASLAPTLHMIQFPRATRA